MNKRELLFPLFLAGLSILFLVSIFFVFLTSAKSEKWIRRKMKIGALLLTFSTVSCEDYYPVPTCYDYQYNSNEQTKIIEIKSESNSILRGSIYNRKAKDYSFALVNDEGKTIQQDYLLPNDCSFDSNYEDFIIYIDSNTKPGNYKLKLFNSGPDKQRDTKPYKEYKLNIR